MRRSIQSLFAVEDYQGFLKRLKAPNNSYEHYLVAFALRKLGNGRGAYEHIVIALKDDPTNAVFLTELLNLRACDV